MNAAAYVGRVGGLAVALGIGAILAGGIGVAAAEESGSGGGGTSTSSSSSSTTSSGSVTGSKESETSTSSTGQDDSDTVGEDDDKADKPEKDDKAVRAVKASKDAAGADFGTAGGGAAAEDDGAPVVSESDTTAEVPDAADADTSDDVPSDSSDTAGEALAAVATVGSAKPTSVASVSTVKSAATIDTAEPFTAAAAATSSPASNPIEAFFAKMRWMFFNATPTVRFDPSESVVNADGTITGKVHMHDADGDKLRVTVRDILNGGTVAVDAVGNFVYLPGSNFEQAASTDRFVITASDAGNGVKFHGILGLFSPGYGESASTRVTVDRSVTAGASLGWGNASQSTNFSSMEALRREGWGVYSGAGNGGFGIRTPDALSFDDNVMTITGTEDGVTGGLAWWPGMKYGMWEIRAKVPAGARGYSPVALLWPDAENWPKGGEINFLEIQYDETRQTNTAALHYGPLNTTITETVAVDATAWHNYAVKWSPTEITFYVDAKPYWTVTDTSTFPPGAMHLCLQLDVLTSNIAGGATMDVAWARQYKLQS